MSKLKNDFKEINSDFLKCGITGWCLEVIWTGLNNLLHHDFTMTSNTSLLMFPIYGAAVCFKPISRFIKNFNFIFRGTLYTVLIFFCEYITGMILKKIGICPWDYSESRFNIKGVIRLDYAPAWFSVGLLFEKILGINHIDSQKSENK